MKTYMKNIAGIILLLLSLSLSAQVVEKYGTVTINGTILPVLYTETDTILLAEGYLDEINISAPRSFTNNNERKLYYRYRRYAAVVYPYAVKAIRIFRELEETTQGMKKRKKKRTVRRLQRELKKDFTDELKKLTKTQGRILVNMIEKELDTPMYTLLKNLKGSFSARYWQTMGSFYDYDLKEGYIRGQDPILDMVLDDFDVSYEHVPE